MKQILFSTGNAQKVAMGKTVCTPYDIEMFQKDLQIDEVQSENSEYVAKKKAEAAFSVAQKPLIISDDSWAFLGLNGFPGTYAKSVNTWLSPDDYLRLMEGVPDRRVLFTQLLVYQDKHGQKLFKKETGGAVLREARGKSGGSTQKITSFEDGMTISEHLDSGNYFSGADTLEVWHAFAEWFSKKETA
jgi:non-canonical purine NTP pyrophosphatase (RdgB/HAM1 family)